jgi:integrase/recombinase XerC/integrase/recombinase XerD
MNTIHAVSKQHFFQHVENFIDYRSTIYETSQQTNKTNLIDLTLFKDFLQMKGHNYIDGRAVMDFQYYLKKQRLNCGASINRKLFTLRSYAKYLNLEAVPNVKNLPFHDVLKCRRGYRTQPAALSEKQIQSLFQAMDLTSVLGIRNYAVYSLMYLLGLRVGEVHQLNLEHIDFDSKNLTVRGKGNKKRILPMADEIIAILEQWLAVRKYFLNHHRSKALFLSKKGNRLAIRTIEDNFIKLSKKAKLQAHGKVTCHTLRHSFASLLNEKQVDIIVIQNLLGHASPITTANYYLHPSFQKVREALEKLPGVIFLNQLYKDGLLSFQTRYHQIE